MSAKVTIIGLKGLEGYKVTVEVQAVSGLNSIVIVGLPDTSIKRIQATDNCSVSFT